MSKKSEIFAERLSILLQERNVKQKELAENLNITSTTISRYIKGHTMPRYDIIQLIANYFNVSADYLLDTQTEVTSIVEENDGILAIPLLSNITKDQTEIINDSNVIGKIELSKNLYSKFGDLIALKIKTTGMAPRLMPGDTIIVEICNNVPDGCPALLVKENYDDAIVRRIHRTSKGIMLIPFNSMETPEFYTNDEIFNKDMRIIGRVVRLIANLEEGEIPNENA